MGQAIVNQYVVLKGEWPIFQWEASRVQHGTHCSSNGTMRSFCQSDGTGRVGSSNIDIITSFGKEVMDFGVTAKFTTTIKADNTIGDVRLVVGDEGGEEIDRRSLVSSNGDFDAATFAISDDHVAGLSM